MRRTVPAADDAVLVPERSLAVGDIMGGLALCMERSASVGGRIPPILACRPAKSMKGGTEPTLFHWHTGKLDRFHWQARCRTIGHHANLLQLRLVDDLTSQGLVACLRS